MALGLRPSALPGWGGCLSARRCSLAGPGLGWCLPILCLQMPPHSLFFGNLG